MKTLFSTPKHDITKRTLADKFIVPPFSVFNTHQPYWRDRLRYWESLGIGGTNGRISSNNGLSYDNRRMDRYNGSSGNTNGTSAFSPVLCEIMYKWFCAPESKIFDPYAGGIIRGAMATILGHDYIGIDINDQQCKSNREEYKKLKDKFDMAGNVSWLHYDSNKFDEINGDMKYDMVFTCPPYYNLEKYSDNPNDLSNATTYSEFLKRYLHILEICYNVLEDDSFCVYVVSDVRDKKTTEYYGLVADTIKSAQKVGFKFYNEIILYNDTGNLAIVSGDYLNKARKVGRQHQNVLVFYKGNPKNIKDKFGEI